MRRLLPTLSCVCLVLLAGCNGLGAADAPSAQPTASAPTTATTTSIFEFPPGVTADGVAEPFTLANAHADALADTSYTVRETRSLRYANGTLRSREVETNRMVAERGVYRYDLVVRGTVEQFYGGTEGALTYYANGSAVARKTVVGNGNTAYGMEYGPSGDLLDPARVYHGTPRNAERIGALLSTVKASVEAGENGTVRIRATELSGGTLTVDGTTVSNVSNVEFRATVAPSGLVREYRLRFEGTVDGRRVTGLEHVRYSDVGSTTVEEPDWLENATR